MRFVSWLALACACVGLVPAVGVAQATGVTAPSFPELFRQAEQSAPRLREIDAAVDAAQGRARQAAAWANPVAGVEVEDVAGSGPYRGSQQAQTTVSLSQSLELAGQRGARAAAGRAGVRSAEAQQRQGRLDFGYELAVAYAEAEAAQSREQIREDDLIRAQEDVRSARALVRAGKEADLRAVQADAAAATAQAELDLARSELLDALSRLSTLAGRAELFTAVTPSLLVSSSAPAPAMPSEDAPLVQAAVAERDLAEAKLQSARRNAIPSPSISVGTRKFAADDAHSWVLGVSFPLPLFDRNRGEIAAARADVVGAQAREQQVRLEAQATARRASAQAQAAVSRQAAADQAETAAREAYRLARIGYDSGRTPLVELLATRATLSEAQSRALDARVARVTAHATLARLAGHIPFAE